MAAKRRYWLVKSEPDVYSIDDLARDKTTSWEGVRNYQARNYIRDDMRVGDEVLFYHSSTVPPGVAGIAKVCRAAHPDTTALDPADGHYDPKATADNPIWMMVDLAFVAKFSHFIPLEELKADETLATMVVCQRGSRLSIQPVEPEHFKLVKKLGKPKKG